MLVTESIVNRLLYVRLLVFCVISTGLVSPAIARDKKIYSQDTAGNILYHKPSATIQEDGRVIQTDSVGNKQYHKQQYQIKNGKIYEIDSFGNIQYHKPKAVIK